MANRREVRSLFVIAGFTLLTACGGLYLGFVDQRPSPQGKAIPRLPDQGPILYEMRSVFSLPNRVHLEWRDVPGASGYRIKIMSAEDESLFVSPVLKSNAWTIPPDLRPRLAKQTVYHWQLTVHFPESPPRRSDPAAFATQ